MYQVIKRDGRKADFDLARIAKAITKAFDATKIPYNTDIINLLALQVTADYAGAVRPGDEMVFLAPGRFSRDNEEKIIYIAGMDWENQVEADDPVVNLNLFNADRDEPVLTPEE